MTVTVEGPDGATYEFPDEMKPGEISTAMESRYPHPSAAPQQPFDLNHALRLGIPFGNQIEAAMRTAQPQALGGQAGWDYGKNLADINAYDEQFRTQHPTLANLGQGTGAAAVGMAASAAAPVEGVAGALGLGSGIGAISGAGAPGSDIRDVPGTASGAAAGASGGALGTVAAPIIGRLGSSGLEAAGNLVAKAFGRKAVAEPLPEGPIPVTNENVEALKKQAYQKVADLGASYSPAQFKGMVNQLVDKAEANLISPGTAPAASSFIQMMDKQAAAGNPVSLNDLDDLRKAAWRDVAGKKEGSEQFFGNMIRGQIDDFLSNTYPVLGQPPVGKLRTTLARAEPKGPELPVATAQPPPPQGPAPQNMLDIMRRHGGLQDEGGDLASMGFANIRGVAPKGALKVIDKTNGIPMDEGLRIAQELGYMEPHHDVSDFINRLGEHPTYSVHDEADMATRTARDDFMRAQDEQGPSDPRVTAWLNQQYPHPGAATAPPNPGIPPQFGAPEDQTNIAHQAITEARDLNTRFMKNEALSKALLTAQENAGSSGTGGNIENTTRAALRTILRSGKNWTPAEKDQFENLIQGTPYTNTMRSLSRLSPKGNALTAALAVSEIPAYLEGGSTMGLVPPTLAATGLGAQYLGNRAREAAVNDLRAMILDGGHRPAVSRGSPQSPYRLKPSAAALAAVLGGGAPTLLGQNSSTQ